MQKAVALVSVEGPPDVSSAASEAAAFYAGWARSLLGEGTILVSPPRVQPPPPVRMPDGEFIYRRLSGDRQFELFRKLASQALDAADSFLSKT